MQPVSLDLETAKRLGRACLVVEKMSPQTLAPRRGPRNQGGSGSGGSSAVRFVAVLDDLEGLAFDDSMEAFVTPVRSIPLVYTALEGGAHQVGIVSTGTISEVLPSETAAVTLADSDCCGVDGAIAGMLSGNRIDDLLVTDNWANDVDDTITAATITGSGVDSSMTVTVEATDGTTTVDDTAIEPTNAGRYTATLNLTSLQKVPLLITSTATDGVSTIVRYAVLPYTDKLDASDAQLFTGELPPTPIRVDIDGARVDSGISSSTTAYVRVYLGDVPNISDPIPQLYVDGVLEWEGDTDTFNSSTSVVVTLTGLTNGPHRIQSVMKHFQDGPLYFYSPASRPLYLKVDTTYDASEADLRFVRTGEVTAIDGVDWLTRIGKCRIQATNHLADRIDKFITAKCTAGAAFDDEDTSVAVSAVTIYNPTEEADPTTPTTIDPEGLGFTGASGDTLYLRWTGSVWLLRQVDPA